MLMVDLDHSTDRNPTFPCEFVPLVQFQLYCLSNRPHLYRRYVKIYSTNTLHSTGTRQEKNLEIDLK